MTEREYINSISAEEWGSAIEEEAGKPSNWGRLYTGDVIIHAIDEFNNDVYDQFVRRGRELGIITDEDEDE